MTETALEHDAAHWRRKYEETRDRLAKLWVFYERARRERDTLRAMRSPSLRVVEPVVVFDPAAPPSGSAPPDTVSAEPSGPYRHGEYTLHRRDTRLKGGALHPFYFFARKAPRSGEPCALPEGHEVAVNKRTGMPFLRRIGTKAKEPKKQYRPQCVALTGAGRQCRSSSRAGSRYCIAHKGYRPPTAAQVVARMDTLPTDHGAKDTAPALVGSPAKKETGLRQCRALTTKGQQCRADARPGSGYCVRHKGYRPRSAVALVESRRTKPRVKGAKDTHPAFRNTKP